MGIMMMIAASTKITFASGNKHLEVESQRFFEDSVYREGILDTITTSKTYVADLLVHVDGFMVTMYFKEPQQWIADYYDKYSHRFKGLEFQYSLEIFLKAPFAESNEPLNMKKIDFLLSKRGEGVFAGAEIGICKDALNRITSTKGKVYWHGKEISSAPLFPFIIKVDGKFDLLSPRLPDRTELINVREEIVKVKEALEEQLFELIQCTVGKLDGQTLLNLLGRLSSKYDIGHCKQWGEAIKGTTTHIFSRGEEGSFFLNGEEIEEEFSLLEEPQEIAFCALSAGGTYAPQWVSDIFIEDRGPKIEIVRSSKAEKASTARSNWPLMLAETIRVEGYDVECILFDCDNCYFVENYDGESYAEKMSEQQEDYSSSQVEDEVYEDMARIREAYNECVSHNEATSYARSILSTHMENGYSLKINSITIDAENNIFSITHSGSEVFSLPMK